jgi:poly-gamma-glutamate capsule biosynthesis protein CapA/YwtB (metallophosphatase superfamily)
MTLRLAAAGDAILTRSIRPINDPGLVELVEAIQAADAGFVNLELATPRRPFVPLVKGPGIYLSAPPEVIDDLQWMGFNLYSNANNHALDWSQQGFVETLDELDRRHLPHAGGGRTLTEARQPAYLETAKGRVALIACTTTWAQLWTAADPLGRIGGRPGINPLRYTTEYGVDTETLNQLAAVWNRLHGSEGTLEGSSLRFFDEQFRSDLPPGVHTTLDPRDVKALTDAIADAREQADWVLFSIHFHEGPQARVVNTHEFAPHIAEAAHIAIDAGADAVIGHGPHRLQGIEVYRGKPILYSLGNLFFTLETVPVLPPECFENAGLPANSTVAAFSGTDVHHALYTEPMWVSAVAILDLDQDGFELELLPVDLGRNRKGQLHALPLLVDGDRADAILGDLAALSKSLGTDLRTEPRDGRLVGVLSVGTRATAAAPS